MDIGTNKTNSANIYGLLKARRACETFRDSSRIATRWNILWKTLSYIIDTIGFILAFIMATNSIVNFIPEKSVTFFLSAIPLLKTIEVLGNFKYRAATSHITKENYRTVSSKVEDALEVLEIISEGGITENETKEWSKMMRFIEELIEYTKKWPPPSKTSSIKVVSAISDLQKIERYILQRKNYDNIAFGSHSFNKNREFMIPSSPQEHYTIPQNSSSGEYQNSLPRPYLREI
jgi:hypothetical protein